MNSTKFLGRFLRAALGVLVLIVMCFSGIEAVAAPCDQANANPLPCEISISLIANEVRVVPENTVLPSGVAVTWTRTDGNHKFKVHFKKCSPFNGQFDFSEGSPASGAADLTTAVIVCKYQVYVGGHSVEPHIIVVSGSRGGGTSTKQ